MTKEQAELLTLNLKIEEVLEVLQQANEDGSPLRCRQLSLAIMNVEQGSHWISARLSEM